MEIPIDMYVSRDPVPNLPERVQCLLESLKNLIAKSEQGSQRVRRSHVVAGAVRCVRLTNTIDRFWPKLFENEEVLRPD